MPESLPWQGQDTLGNTLEWTAGGPLLPRMLVQDDQRETQSRENTRRGSAAGSQEAEPVSPTCLPSALAASSSYDIAAEDKVTANTSPSSPSPKVPVNKVP